MKYFLLLLLFVITACRNENELENSKTYLIQSAYERSKDITIAHNEIHTGVNQSCGWLGEVSTEVSGVTDLHLDVKK